jgi:hypothetical protein
MSFDGLINRNGVRLSVWRAVGSTSFGPTVRSDAAAPKDRPENYGHDNRNIEEGV